MLQELGNPDWLRRTGHARGMMLGIKREAIGATFSIGREPGLAIIGERFGMDSPEGAAYWPNTLPAR